MSRPNSMKSSIVIRSFMPLTVILIIISFPSPTYSFIRGLKTFFSANPSHCILSFFTARCYASAVPAMALCLSVCLSVTSRCSTKTAERRITQTTPHDSPGTLVFECQRSPRNSTGVTPYRGAKCRWGGSKSSTFDK